MAPITVAIAGATGSIGPVLVKTLLSPQYSPSQVAAVKFFSRNPNSETSKQLIALGAQPIGSDAPVAADFAGVDVFVNCLGHFIEQSVKDAYAKAAIEAGVKVYFPSEYGVDYYINPVQHEIFDNKTEHVKYVRGLGHPKTKTIQLAVGFFLEMFIHPWAGLDTKNHLYESPGSADAKVNLVGINDIASSIARLAIIASENPEIVPDFVRVTGDNKSLREIAEIFSKESGEKIEVKSNDWAETRDKLVAKAGGKDYGYEYLSLLAGSGTLDFKGRNDNELVNPGEKYWKWKKVEDYAKEVRGHPPQ